jgi:hypothetical protein
MSWRQLRFSFEVGYRSGDFEHAVISARRQHETLCRRLQK